jgi:hypothetical protein
VSEEQLQPKEKKKDDKKQVSPATCPKPLQQESINDGDDIHSYTRVQMVDVHFRVIQETSDNAPEHLVMISRQHLEDIEYFVQYLAKSSGLSKEDCLSAVEHGYGEPLALNIAAGYYRLTPQQDILRQQQQGLPIPHSQLNQQQQNYEVQNQEAYSSQIQRAQFAQMQFVKQQQDQLPEGQQMQSQMSQGEMSKGQPYQLQGSLPMTAQQLQILMVTAHTNGGKFLTTRGANILAQRYNWLYQQRLLHLRHDMSQRFMTQYGPPSQYTPQVAQQYGTELEKLAKAWVHDLMRREREATQHQQATQATMQAQQM